jgi:hypothetical protein
MVIHGLRETLVSTGSCPELLTADQVSALLGVSAATLNRWAALRETTGEQIGAALLHPLRTGPPLGCG